MADEHEHEIGKYLCLSTGHIPKRTARLLEHPRTQHKHPMLSWEYGWWIWAGPEREPTVCPTLNQLLNLAESLGCQWLRLDRDGPERDDLPQFVW